MIVDRSAGDFGGDRGPKSDRIDPRKGKTPDFQVAYAIPDNQAAIYRLNGDKILCISILNLLKQVD